ncbi:MAG: HEPN domain-containing protein [Burkholderiaceae bacterium]
MTSAWPDKSIAELLLEAARQDLAAARLLAPAPGIGDAMVGFHLQQAVEKSLKAVLSAHGIEFRRTHDLVLLLELLSDKGLPPPPEADWLDELNPYAVEARYGTIEPEGLDRPRALRTSAQVLEWAAMLTPRNPSP